MSEAEINKLFQAMGGVQQAVKSLETSLGQERDAREQRHGETQTAINSLRAELGEYRMEQKKRCDEHDRRMNKVESWRERVELRSSGIAVIPDPRRKNMRRALTECMKEHPLVTSASIMSVSAVLFALVSFANNLLCPDKELASLRKELLAVRSLIVQNQKPGGATP